MFPWTRPRPLTADPDGRFPTSKSTIPERPVGRSDSGLSLTTLDGRYQVLDRIASGGMGEVFRAHDVVLEREVAIKVLHRTLAGDLGFIDRFRREARAAASLNHPNIVAVYDWGAIDGIYFMVMEFVRGRSAREVLSSAGRLEPAQAAEILLQVLDALDHAHEKGIVHRDVKPENVMLTREGVAKVADFGLARAYADSHVTQAGTVTGTVQYLAPEQIRGEPADPRTDLYSLGIVAYELLTGRVPFTAETALAIAYKHLRDRVPPPSAAVLTVPPGLDGWVTSATEKERELRPESAAEARRDLASEAATLPPAKPVAELVRELPIVVPDEDGAERATTVTIPRAEPSRTRGRHRRAWRRAAGVLLALLAVAGAAWGSWTYLIPHYANVPVVVGSPVGPAQARLQDSGFDVKLAKGVYSLSVAKGEVLRVQPAAGTRLRTGTTVTLVPSLGPPPVPVPDLIGKTLTDAKAALATAHLSLVVQTKAYSDQYPAGEIMEQSVAFPGKAPQGSPIQVTVSKGPAPIPVPKVIGKTEDQAKSLLANWVVKVDRKFSDTVPPGQVINQRPDPKTMVQPGQTVTIVVSLGPRTFPMPNVVGMSKDAALNKLEGLGLVVNVALVQVPKPRDIIVYQSPGSGATVKYGQSVTIYVA